LDIPWVLKEPTVNMGKGVTILAPQSDELKNVVENVKKQLQEQNNDDDDNVVLAPLPRLVIQTTIYL
jgi:phosphoribosylamine-glycine ligase